MQVVRVLRAGVLCVARSFTNIIHLRRSVFVLRGILSNSKFLSVCVSFEISIHQRPLIFHVLIPSFTHVYTYREGSSQRVL